jgi:hypothetical protein
MAETFVGRWSRLKRSSATEVPAPSVMARPADGVIDGNAHEQGVSTVPAAKPPSNGDLGGTPPQNAHEKGVSDVPLPEVTQLTSSSDFTPFMRAGVTAATRNAALKKLFADPHFNIMDGLDTYIEDYTISEPIPPEMMAQLRQATQLIKIEEEPKPDEEAKADAGEDAAPSEAVAANDDGEAPAALTESPDAQALTPDAQMAERAMAEPLIAETAQPDLALNTAPTAVPASATASIAPTPASTPAPASQAALSPSHPNPTSPHRA